MTDKITQQEEMQGILSLSPQRLEGHKLDAYADLLHITREKGQSDDEFRKILLTAHMGK